MGWASGSLIAEEVWGIVREYNPPTKRKQTAREIIEVFENEDADAFEDEQLIMQDAEYPENEELEEDLE